MVNTAFARQFTWGCKFEDKCGIYHLCFLFNLSLQFFALNLHGVNYSCSVRSTRKKIILRFVSVCFLFLFFILILLFLFLIYF